MARGKAADNAGAAASNAAKKPAPRGAYADQASPEYVEQKTYVFDQLPVLLGLVMRTRGLTMAQVGKHMGLSESAIRHRLYGRTEFTASELFGLCRALDLDPLMFYDRSYPIDQLLRPRR